MTWRGAWIVWCLFWAVFWLTFGWGLLPLLNLPLAAASGLAVMFPVGKRQQPIRTAVEAEREFRRLPSSVYDPRFSTEERERHFQR